MSAAFWLRTGAIWGFLAVSMGAFGAHGLQGRFQSLGELSGGRTAEHFEASFHTAAQYHMYCALAILAVGLLAATGRSGAALQASGWSFLLGSLIFSGSSLHPVNDRPPLARGHHPDRRRPDAGRLDRAGRRGGDVQAVMPSVLALHRESPIVPSDRFRLD